jgi:hypothetical protein
MKPKALAQTRLRDASVLGRLMSPEEQITKLLAISTAAANFGEIEHF